MKTFILVLILGLTSSWAQARCEVAVYVVQNSASSRIIQKIAKEFDTILKKEDKESLAYAISSPTQTWDADYMFLVIPESNGKISVSVSNLLLNHIFYRNVYNSDAFKSENDVVKTMAADFKDEVLPDLKYCLAK